MKNEYICFKYLSTLKCYYYSINVIFSYDNDKVAYHQSFKMKVCAENQFNQKCNQYITKLDQYNRRISI